MKIKKVYLLSHTHTDFGYTDHLDSVRMLHRSILERALDVCEQTFDAPAGTQHRWTAELSLPVLDFLRHTTAANVDRFVALNKADRIAVGAMSHNITPLVTKPLARHMLQVIDTLRDEFGVQVRTAMQNDINGLGQLWIPLLLERGVDFLTFHQNPHRGYLDHAVPSAWHWQNLRGQSLLVHQGVHYYHGAQMCIGRPGMQNRELFDRMLHHFEVAPHWPFDFAVFNVTNLANSDNAYPEPHLSRAIQEWNAAEAVPIEVVTIDGLNRLLRGRADGLPSHRGEWMDAWADGVASTPLATACARSAERLLPVIEALLDATGKGAALNRPEALGGPESLDKLVEDLSFFDEHTFTAYCSVVEPDSVFAIMQESNKNNLAFRAFAESLRLTANLTRRAASAATQTQVEGDVHYANRAHPEQTPDEHAYIVGNPLDIDLDVYWPVPVDRGAGLRQGVPQAFDNPYFFPNLELDSPVRVPDFCRPSGDYMIQCQLGPGEARVVRPTKPDLGDCAVDGHSMENAHYRVTVCHRTGRLLEWLDKALGRDLIDPRADSGANSGANPGADTLAPQLQVLKPGYTRHELYVPPYWEDSERTTHPAEGDMLELLAADTEVTAATRTQHGVEIRVRRAFPTGAWVQTRFILHPGRRQLLVIGTQFTNSDRQPLSIHWPLYFAARPRRILVETGDGFIDAIADHLPFSCTRWQTVRRGVAFDCGDHAVVVAAPDTPLFQPGGPWATDPFDAPVQPAGGTFWAVNNHWDTNFPAESRYVAPARFLLTSTADTSTGFAEGFCARAQTAPLIVRAPYAEAVAPDVFGGVCVAAAAAAK